MGIIEKMLYEARPFVYGLIGLYALVHIENKTLVTCGIVLLGCSVLVVNMRLNYRNRMEQARVHLNKSNQL